MSRHHNPKTTYGRNARRGACGRFALGGGLERFSSGSGIAEVGGKCAVERFRVQTIAEPPASRLGAGAHTCGRQAAGEVQGGLPPLAPGERSCPRGQTRHLVQSQHRIHRLGHLPVVQMAAPEQADKKRLHVVGSSIKQPSSRPPGYELPRPAHHSFKGLSVHASPLQVSAVPAPKRIDCIRRELPRTGHGTPPAPRASAERQQSEIDSMLGRNQPERIRPTSA